MMLQPVAEDNDIATSTKSMVTGAILLLAVTLDAYARYVARRPAACDVHMRLVDH